VGFLGGVALRGTPLWGKGLAMEWLHWSGIALGRLLGTLTRLRTVPGGRFGKDGDFQKGFTLGMEFWGGGGEGREWGWRGI